MKNRVWVMSLILLMALCAAEISAQSPSSRQQRAFDQAFQLLHDGKFEQAIVEFKAILEENQGNFPGVFHGMGIAQASLGRLAEVEDSFRRAIQQNPDPFPEAYLDLGWALLYQNKVEEAEKYMRSALAQQDNLSEGHNGLGIVLVRKNDLGGALFHFRRAMDLSTGGKRAVAYYNMGTILFQVHDLEEAANAFRQAIAQGFDGPEAHYNLAQTLKKLGKREEAVVHLEKFLQFVGDTPGSSAIRTEIIELRKPQIPK